VTIPVPYYFEEFTSYEEMIAYLAISALQAGYEITDTIIGIA
tara:strand:- start:844 stop:969 length:126 start_codon:yes stop_codon:yes gene_type:complete